MSKIKSWKLRKIPKLYHKTNSQYKYKKIGLSSVVKILWRRFGPSWDETWGPAGITQNIIGRVQSYAYEMTIKIIVLQW